MSAGRQEDDRAALWSRPVNAQTGSGRSEEDAPLPPLEIAGRAGPVGGGDFRVRYKEVGRLCREAITDRLPEDWTWEGKRALDFGCGAGRVLRHFLPESDRCEFHGCDIDQPALVWAIDHLSPPFELFLSREMPPLLRPDASFDLVWATSVFTHLVHESWSAWLLEMHRLLKPSGILIASYLGRRQQWMLGEPWDDERIGMNVTGARLDWSGGGPTVFHSEWWLRAHWGRAFEIVSVEAEGLVDQGLAVMRRRDVELTREDLERPEPGEPRELTAAVHQRHQLYGEAAEQRQIARETTARAARLARGRDRLLAVEERREERLASLERQLKRPQEDNAKLERKLGRSKKDNAKLERKLGHLTRSRSWQVTAPLRVAGALASRAAARRGWGA